VIFSPATEALEVLPQNVNEALRAIPSDGKTGATIRTVGSEGCHDYQSILRKAGAKHASIALPLLRLDKEVEDGPVVPEAVCWATSRLRIGTD
jgi:hypothetical protein